MSVDLAKSLRHFGADCVTIEGDQKAQAAAFNVSKTAHRFESDTVLLHHGVVPTTQALRSIDIPHQWDGAQNCFVPDCDDWGRSAVSTVYIAGDGAGINGTKAAALTGEIAALEIAQT